MIQLITDRTAADVAAARRIIEKLRRGGTLTEDERTAYFAGLRGCYNVSDMNRVGEAIAYLASALREVGYPTSVTPRTDRQYGDIVRASDWQVYLDDVRTLRGIIALPLTTPEVPDTLFVSDGYRAANDIEKILADIDYFITEMIQAYYYSGELYSGEV